MRIGIDFGSTYSTVSVYNQELDQPEVLALSEGESASIPSIVSIPRSGRGTMNIGNAAKGMIGKKTVQIYEAFKMLLNEADPTKWVTRGYTEVNSPKAIAGIYLSSLLRGIANRYGDGRIEEVVICVPEIWCRNIHTLDGRSILRELLKEVIENQMDSPSVAVRVVTEPEAASAFFSYNYEKETKQPFNGHLLLIDYGGGTLDITLTEVNSDGKGKMEIRYCDSCGAGENHNDSFTGYTIGSAGIAYMQCVTAIAMREAGLLAENENPDYTDPDFQAAVLQLENQLKSPDSMKAIADFYDSYGTDYSDLLSLIDAKLSDLSDAERMLWEFAILEYRGEELPVDYRQLLLAYRITIEDVLRSEVVKINKKVQQRIGYDPCTISASKRDDFRIAVVGGFGSFYLVKKQLAEIYQFNTDAGMDRRTKNINADKQVYAISMGAALFASKRVIQKQTARYSIGLYAAGLDKKMRPHYAIQYHQEVDPDVPYYVLLDDTRPDAPSNRKKFTQPWEMQFIIGDSDDKTKGIPMLLKPELQQKLRRQKTNDLSLKYCGFSVDNSGIITFHVVSVKSPKDAQKILLSNYEDMFIPSEAEEVEVKN